MRAYLFTKLRRHDGRCNSRGRLGHSGCGCDRLHVRWRVWRGRWDRGWSRLATCVDSWLDSSRKRVERLHADVESSRRVREQREGRLLRPLARRGDGVCSVCESRGVAERRRRGLMRRARRG